MARVSLRNGNGSRAAQASKYDAHHTVLSKTYGDLADLRRELADSRAAVTRREELLKNFAVCADSQRAWLLLEDYFEKLSLSRKDFPTTAEELAAAIEEALGDVFKLKKGSGVSIEGGADFPDIKRVQIDLDGAQVSATEPPPCRASP